MFPGLAGILSGLTVAVQIEQTDNRTFVTGNPKTFLTVDYGAEANREGVIILAWHGDASADPGITPTCTISGAAATRYQPHSTGDGAAHATGTVIFTGTPSGTSGTVAITWSGGGLPVGIVVLRIVGYSLTPATSFGGAAASDDGSQALTLADKAAVIAIAGSGLSGTDITWSNLTERGDELDQGAGANNRRSWAYDINLPAGGRTVSFTPWDPNQGGNAWSGIVLDLL